MMSEPILKDGVVFKLGDVIWIGGYIKLHYPNQNITTTERMLSHTHSVSLPIEWDTSANPEPTLRLKRSERLSVSESHTIVKDVWYLNSCDISIFYSSKESAYESLRRDLENFKIQCDSAIKNLANFEKGFFNVTLPYRVK